MTLDSGRPAPSTVDARPATTAPASRPAPLGAVILAVALTASAVFVLLDLAADLSLGGDSWQQGDWLIHALNGPIRRGPAGSALLHAADLFGVHPVRVVGMLQAGLVLVLYTLTWWLLRDCAADFTALILIASPAFFVLFWVSDPQAGLRKEIIVFVALTATLLAIRHESRGLLLAGGAAFAMAALAHEANTLFLPLYLYLVLAGRPPSPFRYGVAAGVAVLTTAAAAYAVAYRSVPDVAALCGPLLARGVVPRVCSGSIAWLDRETAGGLAEVSRQLLRTGKAALFPLTWLLATAVYLALATQAKTPVRLVLLLVLSGLPFLVLFPVAVDWGRWLSLQAFSMYCIIVHAIATGILPERRGSAWAWAGLAGMALVWSLPHTGGIAWSPVVALLTGDG